MTTMQIPTHIFRAASRCAGTDDLRFYLNSVRIEVKSNRMHIVSTNGNVLFVGVAPADGIEDQSIVIPMDAVTRVLKRHAKASSIGVMPYLDGKLLLAAETDDPAIFKPVDAKYPDRRLAFQTSMSRDYGKQVMHIDPRFIAMMAKAWDDIMRALPEPEQAHVPQIHIGTAGASCRVGKHAFIFALPFLITANSFAFSASLSDAEFFF